MLALHVAPMLGADAHPLAVHANIAEPVLGDTAETAADFPFGVAGAEPLQLFPVVGSLQVKVIAGQLVLVVVVLELGGV